MELDEFIIMPNSTHGGHLYGESERIILRFALVDTGRRWYVWAFDRNFVVTRVEVPPPAR